MNIGEYTAGKELSIKEIMDLVNLCLDVEKDIVDNKGITAQSMTMSIIANIWQAQLQTCLKLERLFGAKTDLN